jgi:hypothetical protein
MKSSQHIAVVTCDLVKSRLYDARDRQNVQRELLKAWISVEKQFSKGLDTRLSFRVTTGDEFQFVAKGFETALLALTYLRILARQIPVRPLVSIRAAIGIGSRSVVSAKSSYEQDGPAFRAAREQIENLKKKRRLTGVAIEKAAVRPLCNDIFPLMDRIYVGWTLPQAALLRHALLGIGVVEIGNRVRLSRGTVSLGLRRAGWEEYQRGLTAITQLIQEETV